MRPRPGGDGGDGDQGAAVDRSGWADEAARCITHLLSPPGLALVVFLWLPVGDDSQNSAGGKALAILLFSIGPADRKSVV